MNQTVFTHNGFPKVGIRPIIDGRRRGVRESLEDQTMAMAKAEPEVKRVAKRIAPSSDENGVAAGVERWVL